MEILYIDPIAGASGDMFLGALVDLGADFDALRDGLRELGVPGFELRRSGVVRHAIAGTKIDVIVEDVPHPHRHLGDLLRIIDRASLPGEVKHLSHHALRFLAEAESRVHRIPVERVHLHEVGGLDCLVDIVGTMLCVHLLGIENVYSGAVSLGAGFQKCEHGVMPIPVPGTLAILEDFPVRRTSFPYEMTTPTGAAILVALAHPVTAPLVMTPRAVGYGAGTLDPPYVANLLRVVRADVDPRVLPKELRQDGDDEHAHAHSHEHGHDHHQPHDHDQSHAGATPLP